MKLVRGFGINDADYVTQPKINGKQVVCDAYKAWSGMLMRCYSKSYQLKKPKYAGVIVCEEWRRFMSFRAWWLTHSVDGWHLDKDLISDSRVYSPDTCVYVPSWLNNFTSSCEASRGEYPIGVALAKDVGKLRASVMNTITGVNEFLGYFSTPDSAHRAWKSRKLEIALELKQKMDDIDARIYPRVVEIINRTK